LTLSIASNTHLNNKKNLGNELHLPSRNKPFKKNEIETFPPCFPIFPGHHTDKSRFYTFSLSYFQIVYLKTTSTS
jgi:hypothetical protein